MHVSRLSRISTDTLAPPSRFPKLIHKSSRRRLNVIAHTAIIILLLCALVLALLPLLSPEISNMPIFSIQPTGLARANVTMISGEPRPATGVHIVTPEILDAKVSFAARRANENEIGSLNAAEVKAVWENNVIGVERWYGLEGPRVLVGVLRICSTITHDSGYTCTSSSQAAFHAAFLPLSLGRSLFALPQNPPVPVLLLVTSAGLILALMAYIVPLLPWKSALRALGGKRSAQRGLPEDDVESHQALVEARDQARESGVQINWGFLVLGLASCGVALAGVVLQLQDVRHAQKAWDREEAKAVGLEFVIGPSAYMLGFLPLVIALSSIVALTPNISTFRERLAKRRAKAELEAHKQVVLPGFDFVQLREPSIVTRPPTTGSEPTAAPLPPQIEVMQSSEETEKATASTIPEDNKREIMA